jgi:hypothetical protein
MTLIHRHTFSANAAGDLNFIGCDKNDHLIFEIYSEDHVRVEFAAFQLDGTPALLTAYHPAVIRRPQVTHSAGLSFRGPRQRGLRAEDRLDDMLKPLSVSERLHLANHLSRFGNTLPILGIAESRVRSDALVDPECVLVCRQIVIARALPGTQVDEVGLPFDYDCISLDCAHLLTLPVDPDPPVSTWFAPIGNQHLSNPVNCLRVKQHLMVVEQCPGDRTRADVHCFTIDRLHEGSA